MILRLFFLIRRCLLTAVFFRKVKIRDPCSGQFLSGAAVHFAEHETGRRRIISFHGPGTVFPGYHTTDFRIELSLTTTALSEIHVLEFTIPQFQAMFESNSALAEQVVNWYAMYVNRFLFETVHQEFNSSRVKLCNLLYLLTMNQPANSGLVIEMTQEDLADILGISRVHITRELTELRRMGVLTTTRGRLTITDLPALAGLCTDETVYCMDHSNCSVRPCLLPRLHKPALL